MSYTTITTIIFDLDGVLLDTETLSEQSYNICCKEFKFPANKKILQDLTGRSEPDQLKILKNNFGARGESFNQRWKEIYTNKVFNRVPLMPGVMEFLRNSHKAGYTMAVGTSNTSIKATKFLKASGIIHFFKRIQGADPPMQGKPEPDVYLNLLKILNVSPHQCLIIEDSDNGFQAAKATGAHVYRLITTRAMMKKTLLKGHHNCFQDWESLNAAFFNK